MKKRAFTLLKPYSQEIADKMTRASFQRAERAAIDAAGPRCHLCGSAAPDGICSVYVHGAQAVQRECEPIEDLEVQV